MKRKILLTMVGLLFALTIIAPNTMAAKPEKIKHANPFTIQIGVISSTRFMTPANRDLFSEIIAPEINEYLGQLPGNQKLQVEFLLVGPELPVFAYTPERHLEELQKLAEAGVELFIAGGWSSQYEGSIEYVNENDLLMVSAHPAPPLA